MFGNDKEVITMARRILAAGNWKMNKTPSETKALIAEMAPAVASDEVDVLLCVPAIDIPAAVEAAKGTNIAIGGENLYFEESGFLHGRFNFPTPALPNRGGSLLL
jgi:triosephosphate isomerase